MSHVASEAHPESSPATTAAAPKKSSSSSATTASVERIAQLVETRRQLSIKLESIDKRLKADGQSSSTAALQEAKRALELSLKKMQLEEEALQDFLRNEDSE